MSLSNKRNSMEIEATEPQQSKQTKYDNVSTEDLEEATYQIKKSAAAARELLSEKAQELFELRNGRKPSEEELESVFNTLRDRMVDEDCAKSSDSEDDEVQDLENLQQDVSAAFEHVRELGKAAAKKMQSRLESLWKNETGADISADETEAVLYHLKHLAVGSIPVENEEEADDEEDYEPSEMEKEAAKADAEPISDDAEITFNFNIKCSVSEEQFEKAIEKFIETHGRTPTDAEADAILKSFSSSLTEANFDDASDEDYVPEAEVESEDEELDEDNSLNDDGKVEVDDEESEEQEITIDIQSNAFNYMKEIEEGASDDEEEPSKQIQGETAAQAQSVVA